MQVSAVSARFSRTQISLTWLQQSTEGSSQNTKTAAWINLQIVEISPHCNLKQMQRRTSAPSYWRPKSTPAGHSQEYTLASVNTHCCHYIPDDGSYLTLMNFNQYILAISQNTWAWSTMKYTDEFSHFESLNSCIKTVLTASKNTLTLQYCSVINIGGCVMLLNVF